MVKALQNAVANGRVGHAYLFSGPRGTGKTSMARILAKALNCQNLKKDGEACDKCASCEQFLAGTSYDIYELDAASNSGVDAMRDLTSIVALAPVGNYKVYVIDEVHMLSSSAENALLKTLEEPPENVVFVMCTTEPHKVVETVRSRAQHLEFGLIGMEELREHLKWIIEDAKLSVSDADLDYVLSAGAGSVRDCLSALDQVAAAGSAPERRELSEKLVQAVAGDDTQMALTAVEECAATGGDLRIMVSQAVESLRNAFLHSVGVSQERLIKERLDEAKQIAEQVKLPRIVRIIESLGECMAAMRSSLDPRVDLEVALIKLTRSNAVQAQRDIEQLQELVSDLESYFDQSEKEKSSEKTSKKPPENTDAQAGETRENKEEEKEPEFEPELEARTKQTLGAVRKNKAK